MPANRIRLPFRPKLIKGYVANSMFFVPFPIDGNGGDGGTGSTGSSGDSVDNVKFVDKLPDVGSSDTLYICGDAAYIWDGSTYIPLLGDADLEVIEMAVESLDTRLTVVESKLGDLTSTIEDLDDTVSSMEDTVSENSDAISTMKDSVDTLEDNMSSVQGDVTEIKQSITDIEDKNEEITSDLDDLKAKVEALGNGETIDDSELEAIKTSISELEQKTSEFETSINDLQTDVDDLKTTSTETSQAVEDMKESVSTLEDNYETMSADLSEIKATVEEIDASNQIIINDIDDIQNAIVKINSEYTTLSGTVTDISNNYDSINSTVEEMKTTVDTVKEEVSTITTNLEDVVTNVTDLKETVTTMTESVSELQESVETLKEEKTALEEKVSDLTDKVDDIISHLELNETKYADSITEITNYLNDDYTKEIKLASNIEVPEDDTSTLYTVYMANEGAEKVLDLNGYNITGPSGLESESTCAILVLAGTLTINGDSSSTIDGGSNTASSISVWAGNAESTIIINGGNYTTGMDKDGDVNSVVYASSGAHIIINDGHFENTYTGDKFKYVLNIQNNSGSTITCYGGEYVDQNPADGDDKDTTTGATFLADDHYVETTDYDGSRNMYTVYPIDDINKDLPESTSVFSTEYHNDKDAAAAEAVAEDASSVFTDDKLSNSEETEYNEFLGVYNLTAEVGTETLASPTKVEDEYVEGAVVMHYNNESDTWEQVENVDIKDGYVWATFDSLSPVAVYTVRRSIYEVVNGEYKFTVCQGLPSTVTAGTGDQVDILTDCYGKTYEIDTNKRIFVGGYWNKDLDIDKINFEFNGGSAYALCYGNVNFGDSSSHVGEIDFAMNGGYVEYLTMGAIGKVRVDKVVANFNAGSVTGASAGVISYSQFGLWDTGDVNGANPQEDTAPSYAAEMIINFNGADAEGVNFVASTNGYGCNGSITANVNAGKIGYIVGSSNGYIRSFNVNINGGEITERMQPGNRGNIDEVHINMSDGTVEKMFMCSGVDSDETAIVASSECTISGGTVKTLCAGNSNGVAVKASDNIIKSVTVKEGTTTFEDGFEEEFADIITIN